MRPVLLLGLAVTSVAILQASAARAQAPYVAPPPPPPPMAAAPVLPHSFTVSGQYYDASLSGVREFVDTYRETDRSSTRSSTRRPPTSRRCVREGGSSG
jgi:hypothetical protein